MTIESHQSELDNGYQVFGCWDLGFFGITIRKRAYISCGFKMIHVTGSEYLEMYDEAIDKLDLARNNVEVN